MASCFLSASSSGHKTLLGQKANFCKVKWVYPPIKLNSSVKSYADLCRFDRLVALHASR